MPSSQGDLYKEYRPPRRNRTRSIKSSLIIMEKRERETETDRQTERQRQTDRQIDRQMVHLKRSCVDVCVCVRERETERDRETETDRQTDRQRHRQTD